MLLHKGRGGYIYLEKKVIEELGITRNGWFIVTIIDKERKQLILHDFIPDLRPPKKRVREK
ncbi:MAG: hypothetical protein DRJ41_03215 [Thermoprotei archaeon]|nr:MAG: hypothetical protein DRJ41_03215 [Thermoprotei archaeon]